MQPNKLSKLVCDALAEVKAVDVKALDVRNLTSVMDTIIIATGTSNRHVKALSDKVLEQVAKHNIKPIGVEGEREAEWILIDLVDVVVHIMQQDVRDFYNLEKLWDEELLEVRPPKSAKNKLRSL